MFRIGILGSDNSHALAFSKLANIKDVKSGDYLFPEARVTGIFGLDKKRTEEVAREGQIEYIAKRPEDLMDKVDAIMVVFRHGNLHTQYAMPYIRKGIPVWMDKPFTIKVPEARMLVEEAMNNNTLITGGTTCKYVYGILTLKNAVENSEKIGGVLAGAMSFPADINSEYGGLFFYGGHLAEMVMTVFGYDIKSVITSVSAGNIFALAKYDRYEIAMNFVKHSLQYHGIVYGEKENIVRQIDISMGYRLAFEKFIEMLKLRKNPEPLEHLVKPVVLLNAIVKSIETGREVTLAEVDT